MHLYKVVKTINVDLREQAFNNASDEGMEIWVGVTFSNPGEEADILDFKLQPFPLPNDMLFYMYNQI